VFRDYLKRKRVKEAAAAAAERQDVERAAATAIAAGFRGHVLLFFYCDELPLLARARAILARLPNLSILARDCV
jgi:hypothetical protein